MTHVIDYVNVVTNLNIYAQLLDSRLRIRGGNDEVMEMTVSAWLVSDIYDSQTVVSGIFMGRWAVG